MSHIKEFEAEEATGDLKVLYDKMMEDWNGRIPGVLKVLSLNPALVEQVDGLNKVISFGGSSLGRRREEMIATLVSTLNGCHY